MARYPRYGDVSYSFGPGAPTPAVKFLLIANVVVFLLSDLVPMIILWFGFSPRAVVEQFAIYQLGTYMFLHGGFGHLLVNMLGLWMFGTDLERSWGTRFFTKYYFVTGIGGALLTLAVALTPFDVGLYDTLVIGASGAIYGVLVAYAIYYPHRTIYMYFVFPIQVKYFVMIIGAITFYSSIRQSGGGVAHWAHLGGLLVGYVYLTNLRGGGPLQELKYRWLRWKMARARSRFDVYSGGRHRPGDDDWKSDWKKHIH